MRTRTLRNTMLCSVMVYVPAVFLLSSWWGNHGIWAALVILMAGRSLFLTLAWPNLKNAVGAS
jgi:MATE family multidrug resistance protein